MNKSCSIFKALADETRLKIAIHLASRGEMGCQELSRNFKLSQPTLSHHFSKLMASDVILDRKQGQKHYYRINRKLLKTCGVDLKTAKI